MRARTPGSKAAPRKSGLKVFVYGPEALTMKEALGTQCSIVEPPAKAGSLPFFRSTETACEVGDAAETDALPGPPATTLQEWCRLRAG